MPAAKPAAAAPITLPALEAKGDKLAESESLQLDAADFAKKLETMKPEDRKTTLRRLKLAPALQKTPLPNVKNGKVEVQIWLTDLPADGIQKLKAAGFDLAATLTPTKLLLGTLDVNKLDALLELSFVRRVEPPNFS